jgi:hypothetical protein
VIIGSAITVVALERRVSYDLRVASSLDAPAAMSIGGFTSDS